MPLTPVRHALAVVVLGWGSAASSQEPLPLELRPELLASGAAIDLDWAWRYRGGDDGSWAGPDVDDTDWELVEPALTRAAQRSGGWRGVGWFRRHIRLDPTLVGESLTIRVETPGSARVFLDGEPILETSAFVGPAGFEATPGAFTRVALPRRTDHVLAVRYEISAERLAASIAPPGFRLSLALASPDEQLRLERRRVAVAWTFIAVAAVLALLHLALFLSYRRARENLFYAASMAAFAGIVAGDFHALRGSSPALDAVAVRATTACIVAVIFFVLLTYLALRVERLPRTWIGFAALGSGLAIWSWVESVSPATAWAWYAYFGAMLIEIVRVEATMPKVRRPGMSVLLGGLVVMGAIIALQILINVQAVPSLGIVGVYVFGVLAFAMAMSIFLAGTFARTSTHLERKLIEVSALSEQVLAQERSAHAREMSRRLLQAEDARKSEELAAARQLQLSMLPASLPRVDGLELAATMTTATEVGGDYYDFKTAGDGSVVVALGDAAGHGLAAGTMVTATKAIFSVLGAEAALPEMLGECDRVLRAMNVRPLHMCLTLARITPRALTLCSAAMPPVLVHRASTSKVEELGSESLPLGSALLGGWPQIEVPLAPGDTLLFATDGLPEDLSPEGVELGFDGVAAAFAEVAAGSAEEVVRRLVDQASAWRGERPPADDLTVVAVRVLRASAEEANQEGDE